MIRTCRRCCDLPAERLTAKVEQLPISDDAPTCALLRTTLLSHLQDGNDITEPTLLGLLAITGVRDERVTRFEATMHLSPTP